MTIGVVGLGLIGGSLALALRAGGHVVLGADQSGDHEREALDRGLVEECVRTEDLAARCDLVAVAVPVDVAVDVCRTLLELPGAATILELGSTKAVLAKAFSQHPERLRLVLSHPMAGTEFSGPGAAVEGLYFTRTVVLCDREDSGLEHFARAERVFAELGMRPVEMLSAPHDLHVAYVSHISHISSFALSLTVLRKERDEAQIFNLAAGGFASTVRLAKSNPQTWAPILAQNSEHIVEVLDEYIDVLDAFRNALRDGKQADLYELISAANHIAAVLPKNLSL